MTLLRLVMILVAGLLAFGCSSSSSPQPATVTMVVTTSGTLPSGSALAGIGFTFTLPTDVTPPLDATGQVDTSKLVTAYGVSAAGGLAVTAVHLDTQPARISLVVASKAKAGFGVGETMLLTLNLANGAAPKASDFTITEFEAADLAGKAVTGLQAALTLP